MRSSKKILEKLGFAIRKHRQSKGWSQEKLAEHASLHRNYVSAVERGEKNISILNIQKVAGALGVSGAELLKHAGL